MVHFFLIQSRFFLFTLSMVPILAKYFLFFKVGDTPDPRCHAVNPETVFIGFF